jgi:prevent-host-death family protein
LTPYFLFEIKFKRGHMQTVNIHEAKTHLSRLIEQAVKGEAFIIAKAGKPLVKVTRLDAPGTTREKTFGPPERQG